MTIYVMMSTKIICLKKITVDSLYLLFHSKILLPVSYYAMETKHKHKYTYKSISQLKQL